ncbi:alpha/beta hydrolase-fold protein [Ascidiimonas sp. W6]|uniref:alpha/beta hydrolase-fold protein n=1 Tax=Ascidiimonas meishanensis TaxID=3128903 RepID=UPI0030EF55C5
MSDLKTFLIKLTSLEEDARPVFVAGNFNNWNPKHPDFEMVKKEDGSYELSVDVSKWERKKIKYKFTRGGWENVEIDRYGNITKNRKATVSKGFVEEVVEKWRVNWAPFKKVFFPIVELVSEAFEMPQLNRSRKVWALLPYDYYESDKSYPVLYLQDAQNLFSEGSEYGNWEIDKKLSILAEYGRGDIIIIAVEHGDENRLKEYIFGRNPLVKRGEGKKHIRFVTDTLKPFIDKKYRTLSGREYTGIGGSSLGGLISIYGGFLYPEVYSKLMIFSPSLWAVPEISFPMLQFFNPFQTKLYIYGGSREGSRMVAYIQEFVTRMRTESKGSHADLKFKVSINPKGEHTEFYWSQEFPIALEWLYFNSRMDPLDIKALKERKNNLAANDQ